MDINDKIRQAAMKFTLAAGLFAGSMGVLNGQNLQKTEKDPELVNKFAQMINNAGTDSEQINKIMIDAQTAIFDSGYTEQIRDSLVNVVSELGNKAIQTNKGAAKYQTATKQGDYQSPTKQSDYQSPTKQGDYQSPTKQGDYKSDTEQSDYQSPTKQGDYQSPTKQGDYQSPTKQGDYKSSTKVEDYSK